PGADGQLRTESVVQARLAVDLMVGGIRVGDVLVPAHPRNPRGCRVAGFLRSGNRRVMAVDVELATDCPNERLSSVVAERRRRFLPMAKARGLRADVR